MDLLDVIDKGDFELIKKKLVAGRISKKLVTSTMVNVFFKENTINSLFSMLIMSFIDMLSQRSVGFEILGIDRFKVVDELLRRKYYEDAYNKYFEEFIQCCVQKKDFEAIEYLLKTKTKTLSIRERTVILKQAVFSYGELDAYKFLKQKKLAIKCVVKSDFTPLMSSIRRGDIPLFNFLVNEGVDINEYGTDKITPLLLAAFYGNIEIARLLLSLGANPHTVDSLGRNAIFHACNNGSIEMVNLFLEAGVEIIKDNFKTGLVCELNESAFIYVKQIICRFDRASALREKLLTK